MGWSFTSQTRERLIHQLVQPHESEKASSVVLDHALADEVLWSVVEITAKQPGLLGLEVGASVAYIRCDLLEGSAEGWGYKTLEESSHPYYYSCPLRFLDMAPVQSSTWRDGVRAFHAQ